MGNPLSTFLSGGEGLVSTIHDYYRFCQCMLNGGQLDGVRILGRKTCELMTTNHLPKHATCRDMQADVAGYTEIGGEGVGFGLGFGVTIDTAATGMQHSVGTFAWGGAAATRFWIDPVEDLVVVMMTQVIGQNVLAFSPRDILQSLVYSSIADEPLVRQQGIQARL